MSGRASEPRGPLPLEPRGEDAASARTREGSDEEAAERCRAGLLSDEVLAAVVTLYEDELRPYGRIIRKRLAEHAEQSAPQEEVVGAERLRALCEGCPRLRVEPEDGGEFAALLVDRPASFVDIYSRSDPYPEELWREAAEHFASLGDGEADRFPGGRYASARALAARCPPFLRGRSLGQVCHIMQLAITRRQLLGYRDGAIVPYSQSTSMRKSRCAQLKRPCAGRAAAARGDDEAPGAPPAELRLACWEQTLRHVREILENALERGQQQVPLSNIKRLFRSRYGTELSETALGHARLSDLLQDGRFRGVCTVRLQARGYVVVPAGAVSGEGDSLGVAPGGPAEAAHHSAPLAEEGGAPDASPESWEPSTDDEDPAERGLSPKLRERRTFLELSAPPPPPRRPRSLSCPQELAHLGKRRCLSLEAEADQDGPAAAAEGAAGWQWEPAEDDARGEEAGAAAAAGALPAAPRVRAFCEGEPLPLEEAGLLPGCAPLATPSPLEEAGLLSGCVPLATPSPLCQWFGHLQGPTGATRALEAVAEEARGVALQTPSPVLHRRQRADGERRIVRLADLI